MNKLTKSRFEVIVTSYGRNKNLDDEIKKIEMVQTNKKLGLE